MQKSGFLTTRLPLTKGMNPNDKENRSIGLEKILLLLQLHIQIVWNKRDEHKKI